jgi:tetratricopeptide (TPR) repeat protein
MIAQRLKSILITISVGYFAVWLIIPTLKNNTTTVLYTIHDFHEDICKIYLDMGLCAQKRNDLTKAIDFYNKIIEHNPFYLPAYDKLGICYELKGNQAQAIKIYFKAMAINANFNDTRFISWHNNIDSPLAEPEVKVLGEKLWAGESLLGKTIYIYTQKGLGDTIMFSRFLPILAKMGAKIIFKPQKPLISLFKTNYFYSQIIDGFGDALATHIDFYAPIESLPALLNTSLETIPAPEGYINSSISKIDKIKAQFFKNNKYKVGIIWQGSINYKNDKQRSIALSYFYPLTKIPGVAIYSLQRGYGAEQLALCPQWVKIVNLEPILENFDTFSAVMQNLDLIISVDTAGAHLGGALGKKTWLLLPHTSDWRWLVYSEGETTVWYKSIKKFRQKTQGDWAEVFTRVTQELAKLTENTEE